VRELKIYAATYISNLRTPFAALGVLLFSLLRGLAKIVMVELTGGGRHPWLPVLKGARALGVSGRQQSCAENTEAEEGNASV